MLTTAQLRVMRAIAEHWERHGYAPSFRGIASDSGFALSTVKYHIHVLQLRGLLASDEMRARTTRLTKPGRLLLESA